MQSFNLLVFMSDQHNPKALGQAGHPVVKTPNLDALAEQGTRFTSAYTHSPLCVPARAAFATGRYIHDTGNWDNASPYDGSVASWAHRLRDQGFGVRSIGKLHYRSAEDDNGFRPAENAMYVVEGQGDLLGCLRDDLPPRPHSRESILNAGRGPSSYTRYDEDITAATIRWLREEAAMQDKPWVLFCSMVCPHPPKMAPAEDYDLYPWDQLPWPVQARPEDGWTNHPAIAEFRRAFRWDEPFTEEQIRNALAAYFGQISFLDRQIGRVIAALDTAGLRDSTRIVYTTDHGDNMGNRGLWNKNTLYEDSAGVPMILAGPDIPRGISVETPVTHLDCFPTFVEAVGGELQDEDDDLPGQSLLPLAHGEAREKPILLSQYHGSGARYGGFIVRIGSMKYIHYVGAPAQLFNLESDPDEINDLSSLPEYAQTITECERELRDLCDPEAVDRAARACQAEKVAAAGGRDAVIARGGFNGSPVPGEAPQFASLSG